MANIDPSVSHDLIIAISTGIDKKAKDMKVSSNFYGTIARYNFRISANSNSKKLGDESPTLVSKIHSQYDGILINQDFNRTDEFYFPTASINAKPGEKVALAVRAGGDATRYVGWITLNWKQSVLNDLNENYFYFQIKKQETAYFKIQITAPSVKGDYELCGYLIPNPWKQLDDGFMEDIGFSTSYRTTLHVE